MAVSFDIDESQSMKKLLKVALPLLVLIAVAVMLHSHDKAKNLVWNQIRNPETVRMLKQFVAVKKAQAYAATNNVPSEIQTMFKYAEHGDWLALSNSMQKLRDRISYWNSLGYGVRRSNDYRGAVEDIISDVAKKVGSPLPWDYWVPPNLNGTAGEAIKEVYGTLDAFMTGDEKYSSEFGHVVIDSIPADSIYFGGTDPGRFLITAMEKSQPNGDPFFIVSQNPLSDSSYLDYLRSMYAGKIYTLTDEDLQKSFQDYTTDVQRRLAHDQQSSKEPRQLKPGEHVSFDSNGRIQMSSHMNVIGIRELLTKTIFDKNPDREFYVEESFPLDWMYPYLEPHGLIMKINRQQLPELSAEIVQRDGDYWTKYVTPMIGGWLKPDTTIEEVAAFAEKIHMKKDLSGFAGDPQFVQSEYWCENFSKLRSSIGGLYAWRAQHATDAGEKKRMNDAADFAFRQAWALCPYSSETVFRYVNLLMSEHRTADALLILETAEKMPAMQGQAGGTMRVFINQLKELQKAK
jgi:hypothetical protein